MLLLHSSAILCSMHWNFLKRHCKGGGERKKRLPYRGIYDLTGDLLVSIVAMDRNKYLKEHIVTSKNSSS